MFPALSRPGGDDAEFIRGPPARKIVVTMKMHRGPDEMTRGAASRRARAARCAAVRRASRVCPGKPSYPGGGPARGPGPRPGLATGATGSLEHDRGGEQTRTTVV